MKATRQEYRPDPDFGRVRDFFADTFHPAETRFNWRIDRWNYARYFVMPMIGMDGRTDAPIEDGLRTIRFWEEHTAIWETETGEIVGVVALEYPWHGDAFPMRRPGYDQILPELLDYSETVLMHREKRTLSIHIYDHDQAFQALARERGYQKNEEYLEEDSVYPIDRIPDPGLPEGYGIRSMADESDIERRREVFGRAFNHVDPAEWPSAFSYQELQRAPDYRPEQDLFIVSQDGRYVACCIVWHDEVNKIGILEPVGTHPDFRRRGLGQEVVMEGIRQAASRGATEVWVGSGQRFYEAIGFEKRAICYTWTKRF